MSLNTKGLKNVRWCPWCGVDRLERDSYPTVRHLNSPRSDNKHEFICQVCGVAFRILDSTRKQDMNRLMAHERRQRVSTPTNPETAEKQAKERFSAICKKKFKEFKHLRWRDLQTAVGEEMRQWLESEEAARLRPPAVAVKKSHSDGLQKPNEANTELEKR